MTEHVKTEIEAGIMTLTLARPDKKNALSNAMYSAMSDGLERAEKDPAVRVVLFQGDGDSFTAGNDISDFSAQANGTDTSESQAHRFISTISKATRPVVAAVQGNAVGVGTTMLLHCDLVYLADTAKLMTPFVNLALVPEAASTLLMPLRVGYARAYEMFALGETIEDRGARILGTAPPARGTRFAVIDFSPGNGGRMHRTETIDYVVVIAGAIDMDLDDSTVRLKAGDVMVQRGTNHAWINRGTVPARLAFVLIDAVPLGIGHPVTGGAGAR